VHKVAVKVGLDEFTTHQVLAVQIVDLLFSYEFVFVVYKLCLGLFELLSHVLEVGNPFWSWAKFRNKENTNFRVLLSRQDQP
jgi:hypothetical protein